MYDTIIIGGGPAGLAAGIYAKRSELNALIVERYTAGGQVLNAHYVDNYPGAAGISGSELMLSMERQAARLGCEIAMEAVTSLELAGDVKAVTTAKRRLEARTVILAMGSAHRRLGLPGEEKLAGLGLSYCATCDGAFFKGMDVAVIGGGDTAVMDALYLAKLAKSVHVIHRRDAFRAAASYVEVMRRAPNIELALDRVVVAFEASLQLDGLRLKNVKTGDESSLPVDGAFVAIGSVPQTDMVDGVVTMENGYIVTDERMRTSMPGVFAAGDIRAKPLRQIVTAAADGAVAANEAFEYLLGGQWLSDRAAEPGLH